MKTLSRPRYELRIEKDVEIALRDGVRLRADIFRPGAGGRFPALVNIGAYHKDKVWVPPPDLEEKPNRFMNWETVNPLWWVPRGYAAVRVDGRGSGKSPGQTDPFSLQEALDFYDCIEWCAKQPCLGFAGNWSGMGLHLRGNTEASMRAGSRRKKLRIHAGTHYHPFYAERTPDPARSPAEGRRRQRPLYALQRRLQYGRQHHLRGRHHGLPPAAAAGIESVT